MNNYNLENINLLLDGKLSKFHITKVLLNKSGLKNKSKNCIKFIRFNKRIIFFIIINLIFFFVLIFIIYLKEKLILILNLII